MGASTLTKKELFRLHMGEIKEDYATLMGDCEYYESQIENLQDENDRLRKMCADMRLYFDRSLVMSYVERVSALDDIVDRMDELGIEVGDGKNHQGD